MIGDIIEIFNEISSNEANSFYDEWYYNYGDFASVSQGRPITMNLLGIAGFGILGIILYCYNDYKNNAPAISQ